MRLLLCPVLVFIGVMGFYLYRLGAAEQKRDYKRVPPRKVQPVEHHREDAVTLMAIVPEEDQELLTH